MRAAINKFKKRIFEEQNHHYGSSQHFLMKSAFHMYYHTLGKCNLDNILNARHRIMKLEETCTDCEENLYKLIAYNKLYCMNVDCIKAICSICRRNVSTDPREDFKHFYIHSGILPGMCPLFEDYDSLGCGFKCSNSKPCYSTEPTVMQLDDYITPNSNDDLPSLPCNKCKEVMNNNPSLIDKCLKIQKYGLPPKEGKKYCKRSKLEIDNKKSSKFYEEKEYHFFNCYICGWSETEKHFRTAWVWKDGQRFWFEIPMSVDQRIFSVDHTNSPEFCCFGNNRYGQYDQYTNFEFICNLNEHMKDHGPQGKSCIMIEVLLKQNKPILL